MSKQKTLAIMAAGLGTRFGSLKQLHPVSSEGYSIIDYSIYDAISVGFNNIIFIIREEIVNQFKARFDNKLPKNISVNYIIQSKTNIPEKFTYHTTRNKPWGTGQALLSLKDYVTGNFALINADDFYGKSAFQILYDAMYNSNTTSLNQSYFVGYQLSKTLSEYGSVSRGECFLNEQQNLLKIIERTKIEKIDNGIAYFDSNHNKTQINSNTIVSMNFWGFSPEIFSTASKLFNVFLNDYNPKEKETEFYISTIVDYCIKNNLMHFNMLPTNSQWYGITYISDNSLIYNYIQKLTDQNIYPKKLWKTK